MDGHAILERLAHERPHAFLVLVLSSHADESMQVRSLFAGAVDHLPKPFNVRVLMAKLNRFLSLSTRVSAR
jgi:DNA-binding response OmpR family regulator